MRRLNCCIGSVTEPGGTGLDRHVGYGLFGLLIALLSHGAWAEQAPVETPLRHKIIDTRVENLSPVYANYVRLWVRRVERVAATDLVPLKVKLDAAVKVLADVSIHADGTLHEVRILESSGYPLVDESIRRVVLLAGPFLPFGTAISHDADVLHIHRVWHFYPLQNGKGATPRTPKEANADG